MTLEEYPAKLTTGYYRVRETWDEPASQVGAYRLLKSAMTTCDANPGTFVFDDDGNAIYPEVEEAPAEEETPVEETKPAGDVSVTEPETAEPEENGASGEDVSDTTETDPMDEEPEGGPADEEFPEAIPPEEKATDEELDVELPEYENDGSEEVVGYAKLKTLMNIRHGNALNAPWLTTYKKGTIVEVLQVCENGWLRIRCNDSDTGFAYVSAADAHYTYGVGQKLYTVKHKDNLWKIAEEQLGSGLRYTDIRVVNGLTCNVIRVGMVLIMP